MPKRIYYAMLVRCESLRPACETRFFTGYNLRSMRKALQRLAEPGSTLQQGLWSIHGSCGTAVEAHTFSAFSSSRRWRKVNRISLQFYNLNAGGLALARNTCDTIGRDGTITENNKR